MVIEPGTYELVTPDATLTIRSRATSIGIELAWRSAVLTQQAARVVAIAREVRAGDGLRAVAAHNQQSDR